MKLNLLILGASLFASQAWAGSVSGVAGTLDTTLVDPSPTLYPHFICASGCNSGSNTSAVSQSGAWSVGITNFPTLQSVTGTVSVLGGATAAAQPALNPDGGSLAHVTNFPTTQPVTGSVSISNFPVTQAVSGTVSVSGVALAANQAPVTSAGTSAANGQAVQGVTGGVPVGISGAVTVSNLPVTQPVSGSVSISNLPTTQAVSGTFWPSVQPVSGSVTVSNFPTTQSVSGSVSVGNFPSTQTVSGTVAVSSAFELDSTAQSTLATAGAASSKATGVQGVTSGVPIGISIVDGNDASLGAQANAPCASATTACSLEARTAHIEAQMVLLNANTTGATPAGAAIIGATFSAPYSTTDASSIVTVGGSFQTVFALNTSRRGCTIKNPSTATEVLYVHADPGTATIANSFDLTPGQTFKCNGDGIVVTDLVQVEAATTGHSFVAKSQ